MNIYLYNHNHFSPDGEQVRIGLDNGQFKMLLEKNTKDAYLGVQTFATVAATGGKTFDQLRMSGRIPCDQGRMGLVNLGGNELLLRIGEIGNQNIFFSNDIAEVEGEDGFVEVVLAKVHDDHHEDVFYFLSNITELPTPLPRERVKLRRSDFSPEDI